MLSIWLDTDIGSDIDDAVALLCAARHPEIDLLGVSTVYGRVELRAWLARDLLARAEKPGVPVLPGAVAPTVGNPPGPDIYSYGASAPDLPPLSPADDLPRISAIAQAMSHNPQPFHLLTIGPLTNIALLLGHHPALASRWVSVTCMAGRLDGDPDYNVHCDPHAARIVCERLGPRLIGLEASSDTLTRAEAEASLDSNDPASAFLLECYREYRANAHWLAEHRDQAPLTLYDPITLLSLVSPDGFDFQQLRILVEKDGRLRLTDDGSPVTYALSSDWASLAPLITALLRGTTR